MAPRGERATLGPGPEREGTPARRGAWGRVGGVAKRPRPTGSSGLHPPGPKCVQGGLPGFGAAARGFKRLSAQAAHGTASLLPAAAPPRPRPLPLSELLESPAAACGRDAEGSPASQGFPVKPSGIVLAAPLLALVPPPLDSRGSPKLYL